MDNLYQVENPDLARNIVNGLVVSVVSLAYSLSYAALVFSGPLSSGLAYGVGFALMGSAVAAFMVARKSSFPYAIAGPDSNNSAVLAAIVAAMAVEFPREAGTRALVVNALYLLVISSAFTGLCLYALGRLRMGRWIRFVPYPVTGGFIAGVGWLMVIGGFQIITNEPITLASLLHLFAGAGAPKAAVGAAWTSLLIVVLGRFRDYFALPALLLGGTLASLGTLALCGFSIDEARRAGWLFSLPQESALWTPWSLADLLLFDPQLVLRHMDGMLTVVLVTTLSILMNATGIEMETRQDADLDQELQVQGGGHLAAATLGGFPGYISMSRSLLNFRLGSRSRVSGYVVAIASLAFALAGPAIVSFIAKPVLGGLIVYLGCTLLWTWIVLARKIAALPDYLTIVFIAVVVTIWGFVTGVIVGIVAGCIIFAVNYSRVNILKHQLDGAIYNSSRVRSPEHTQLLRAHGEEIQILVLQGFIFFGTADRLYRLFIDQVVRSERPVRFLIMDFRFVDGIDASALSSFRKICSIAETQGTSIVATGASQRIADELLSSRYPGFRGIASFETLDEGLEWCESTLLEARGPGADSGTADVISWLDREFGTRTSAEEFLRYATRRSVPAGEYLCREHESADSMFFIEKGSCAVEQQSAKDKPLRLRKLGHNTMFGEMGLYRSALRTASVVAQEDSVVYVLTREALDAMRRSSPEVAEELSSYLIKVMSERLAFSNVLCMTLQR